MLFQSWPLIGRLQTGDADLTNQVPSVRRLPLAGGGLGHQFSRGGATATPDDLVCYPNRRSRKPGPVHLFSLLALFLIGSPAPVLGQVVISEIMYHPVEEPAFNANGTPVLDLYEDVHEFVEIHNPGLAAVPMAGWKLSGGISFTFPSNAVIQAGEYRVVAKDPVRLAAVAAYGLAAANVLGPYTNQLSNRRDTVRIRNADDEVVDAVSYAAEFPWAISADALGADPEWTGINPLSHQYRGRSLERVSFTHPANDPANWLASPLPGNPSPGRSNAVSRAVPKPVAVSFQAAQSTDESTTIRNNQPVRIDAVFSGTNLLSGVAIEWFVDNIEVTNETHTTASMLVSGPAAAGAFTVVLPGQPDRSVVRFRFRANRGTGDEVVSPRADDPYGWHAYFVTPVRTSTKPIYDCFISTASLGILATNIQQSPRRVTSPDPPGNPRASWNATQPAIMVCNGVVYDIRMRHHGSRYNRSTGRQSFKWEFPKYRKFNGLTSIFETDKGNDFVVGHGLFIDAGLPVSKVQYVDLYLNNNGVLQRLEQGEFDGALLDSYHLTQQELNPGAALEPSGEIYKSVGTIDTNGEGPYGRGDGRKLAKPGYWTDLQMYDWTYALQNHGWRGSAAFKEMIDAMWVARGDTPNAPNPNVPALRSYFSNYFDIDEMLTYIAVENWCCPWDDTTQNHFLWQRRNGKWGMLPWDCDAWFGNGDNTPASSSIYIGEVGDPNNNFRGPNFFKDSFIKAFRQEYKERLFLLNNTFLHPDNILALGYGSIVGFAQARFDAVNQQCGFGAFQRPDQPVQLAPAHNGTALPPQSFQTAPYAHSSSPAPAHAATIWEIRSETGTFTAPLWKVTSSTNLTSIPIPFEALEFGSAYHWRCTFVDADGHPSLPSGEGTFSFGPAPTRMTLVAIDATTPWRYNQTDNLTGVNWMAAGFNDSSWPSGPALLAVEDCNCLPEPIRTPLALGRTTYYFRTHFNFPGNPQGATLRLRQVIDDGCIVYLNGVELSRTRQPAGTNDYDTLANPSVANGVYEGPIPVGSASLVQGDNVLAVEVHQSGTGSSDLAFGLELEATLPTVVGDLVLNEVAADNRRSVTNGVSNPDWIELFNSSSQAIDLGGMSLSDDVLVPGKYYFPSNTLIAAQGYRVVWCDDATNAPGLHTGFGLNNRGQTVVLFAPGAGGTVVRDFVTFGLQVPDRTVGRVVNGTGGWQLTQPTPGGPNVAASLGASGSLRINEWMASPESGDDWFELYNPDPLPVLLGGLHLTDTLVNPTNSRVAPLTFIAGGGFAKFQADENPENGSDHVDFKLGAGGDSIGLFAANGVTGIDSVTFGAQTAGVSQGRFPDGSLTVVSFPATPSPERGNHLPIANMVINEVLTHTDPPLQDSVELFNPTTSAVNIGGWYLSDSLDQLKKYRVPDNTVIPAGGYQVFTETQFNADTNLPTSFSFSSARGDDVYLSIADAGGNLTGYRTHVDFGAAQNGVSFGRFATSVGIDFTALSYRTFAASNAYPRVGPIVVSEVMYHPPDLGTNDNTRDEFIELYNLSPTPQPLFDPVNPANTWRLRGDVDFDFPTNLTLAPGGQLLVVGFDPATNTVERAAFEAKYGPGLALFGPYQGKLANGGGSVEVEKPDPPQTIPGPDFGFVPYIRVDRVKYTDTAPWPAAADGTGASLQRLDVAVYGNEPTNWFASGYTPGGSHLVNMPPLVTLTSPTNGATFASPVNINLAATAADPGGAVGKVEFYSGGTKVGEDSSAPYTFVWSNASAGSHVLTARATDDQSGVRVSPPVFVVVTGGSGDSDNDGLPDAWETLNGLVVGNDDAGLDPDADGMTNLQEYLAGTNPQDGGSALRLEAIPDPAGLTLRFTAQAGKSYAVQFRDNLGSGLWQTYSNVPPPAVTQVVQMLDSSNAPGFQRWYQLTTPAVP